MRTNSVDMITIVCVPKCIHSSFFFFLQDYVSGDGVLYPAANNTRSSFQRFPQSSWWTFGFTTEMHCSRWHNEALLGFMHKCFLASIPNNSTNEQKENQGMNEESIKAKVWIAQGERWLICSKGLDWLEQTCD